MQVPPPLEDVSFPEQTAGEAGPKTEEGTAPAEIEELVIKRPPPADTDLEQDEVVGGIFSSQHPLQRSGGERGPVSLLLQEAIAAEGGESGVEDDTGLLREQSKKTFVTELVGASECSGESSPFTLGVERSHGLEVSSMSSTGSETTSSQVNQGDCGCLLAMEVSSPLALSGTPPVKPSSSKPLLLKGSAEKPGVTSKPFKPLIEEVTVGPAATDRSKESFKALIEEVDPSDDDTSHSSPTLLRNPAQEESQNKEKTKTGDVEEALAQPKKDSFRPFIEVVEPADSAPHPPSTVLHSRHTASEEALEDRSNSGSPAAWAQSVAGRPLIMEISDDGRKDELQVEDIEGGGPRDLDATKEGASNSGSMPSLVGKGTKKTGVQESKLMELAETAGSTVNRPPPDTKLYQELKKKWSKQT